MPNLYLLRISALCQKTAQKTGAYHSIGISRWNGKSKPPPQALQEPEPVRTDDIPHNAAVEAGNVHAENSAQDEEERVQAERCNFLGRPVRERDPQ